jgi:hypothetical protein
MRRRLRVPGPAGPESGARAGLAAVLVPALLLAGLAAGGTAGWRSVTGHPAAAPGPPAAPPLLVRSVEGPVEELRGQGEIAYAGADGAMAALTPDGRARRTLGRAGQLRGKPAGASGEPGGTTATVSADGADAYGYLDDGSPASVRLADARVRRLSPPGTVAATAIRQSADGAVVAVCTGKRHGETGVDHPVTSILERDGHQLASFAGCLLDLARDGRAALVPEDPGGASANHQGPVKGVRLWRRSGSYRPVLPHSAAVEAAGLVDATARPGNVVVDGAWLAPDARRALVRVSVAGERAPVGGWRSGPALVLVDLASRRWELVPSEAPSSGPRRRPPNAAAPTAGAVIWAPNGAFAHALPPDSWDPTGADLLVTYAPPVGTPTLLEVSDRTDSRMVFSPDGAWLLLHGGGQWVFIRVDDPSLRVSYVAPGQFAGWLPGQGTR